MKKLSVLFFLIAALMLYTSCKKGDIQKDPDPTTLDSATIMGFKDSTQLIKSFTTIDYDTTGVITDSGTSYISYDTVNRKITVSNGISSLVTEYSYNGVGLLVHKQESGDSSSNYSFDYTYDASNIIKTASINQPAGGGNSVYSINKTSLPSGGYQLGWWANGYNQDSGYYLVNFDNNGKMLSYYDFNAPLSDSVLYDINGDVSKVIETFYTTPSFNTNGSSTFSLYDFSGRDTKGDQLYNFFQILYNGVANIPPGIAGFGPDFSQDFVYQDTKYPALSTNINRPVGGNGYYLGCALQIVNFNNAPQYDSKNRLVRYSTFFNDVAVYRTDIVIRYYK